MFTGPSYLGRRTKNDVVVWKFSTDVAGVLTTLSNTPAVKAYENGSNVEFTGGITLSVDYDGKTGLHELSVDTSNAAFNSGKIYDFFISAGNLGANSAVGIHVGHFELIPEPADLRMVNGGTTGATAGRLQLEQLKITAAAGQHGFWVTSSDTAAVQVESSASTGVQISGSTGSNNNPALNITSNGGPGISIGGHLNGVEIFSDTTGDGIYIEAQGSEAGIHVVTDGAGAAVLLEGNGTGSGLICNSAANDAMSIVSQSGNGIFVRSVSGGDVINLTQSSTGKAINALGTVAITTTGSDYAVNITADAGVGVNVHSNSSIGLQIASDTGGGGAVEIYTGGTGNGVYIGTGAPANDAVQLENYGGGTGNAINLLVDSPGTGKAINALGQVLIQANNADDDAVHLISHGNGNGMLIETAGTGNPIYLYADASDAMYLEANGDGRAIVFTTDANNANAIEIEPNGTGKAIDALGQVAIAVTGSDNALDITAIDGIGVSITSQHSNGAYVSADNAAANHAEGVLINANNDGVALALAGGGVGLDIFGASASALHMNTVGNGDTITLAPDGTGKAINALGQIYVAPSNLDDSALLLTGNGSGSGLHSEGGATGTGIESLGGVTSGSAVEFAAQGGNGKGLYITGNGSGVGMGVNPGATGVGLFITGGLISGDAVNLTAIGGNSDALQLSPVGSGLSINAAVETGVDLIGSLRLANAANGGKTNGLDTTTVHVRDVNDTKNRVTATVDVSGNRSAVTLDLT